MAEATTVGNTVVCAPLQHSIQNYTQDCLINQKYAADKGPAKAEGKTDDQKKDESTEKDQLMSKEAEARYARFIEVDSQCRKTLIAGFNDTEPCDTEPHWQAMILSNGAQEQVAALRCVAFLGMPGSESDRVGRGLMMITKAKEPAPDGSKYLLNWVLLDNSSNFDAREYWGEQKCCCFHMSDSIKMRHESKHNQKLTWDMMPLDYSVGTASLSASDKATLLSTTEALQKGGSCCSCCSCFKHCSWCCACCSYFKNKSYCSCFKRCTRKDCNGTGGSFGKGARLARKLNDVIEEVKVTKKQAQAVMPEMEEPKQVTMSQEMTTNKYRVVTAKLMHMGNWHDFTAVVNPDESPSDVYKFTQALSIHRPQVEAAKGKPSGFFGL